MWEVGLFGFMSAAAVWLAALSMSDRYARTIAALLLLGACALANASFGILILWPIMDALMGTAFILWWLDAPASWKAQLFALFLMQSLCHVAYHLALAFGSDIGYCYTAALNALFICQLWVVSSDGIKRGRDLFSNRFASFFGGYRSHGVRIFARQAR